VAPFGLALVGAAFSILGWNATADRYSPQRPPEVAGVITDSSGSPIAFAQVRGPGVDPRVSDDSGRFRFTMRKSGRLSLEIRRVGFRPLELTVPVVATDTALALIMHPLGATLETVRIEAEATVRSLELHGFYDRLRERERGTNTGHFIMPEEIEARRGTIKVTQLVQGIPSMRVVKISAGAGSSYDALVGAAGCPMMIYLDGQRLNRLGGGVLQPVNIEWLVTTRDLAGVEVYTRANAPDRYRSFALNCGVVLLWTK
jgi:hypothetical protein